MLFIFDKIIYLIVYVVFILGIWLLLFPLLSPYIHFRKYSRRTRIRKRAEQNKTNNRILQHLNMLLAITLNTKSPYALFTFVFGSLAILVIVLILLTNSSNGVGFNILLSTGFGMLPYLILYARLHSIRINSSYEGVFLLTELTNQYKINYLNMIEAIDHTIPRLKNYPHTKKALAKLGLAIKQYKSSDELESILNEFYFAIDTSWAMLLTNNLYLSIHFGDDVREALEDILKDLRDLKNINEKNKQYNHEAFLMIKYLAPGMYLLSMFSMFSIFGFSLSKYINYQLINPLGFRFFMITVILSILNFSIYLFVKRPKNDF